MDQRSKQNHIQLCATESDSAVTRGGSGSKEGRRNAQRSSSLRTLALLFIVGVLLCQLLAPAALLAKNLSIPRPDADYISDQAGIVGAKSRKELKRLNQGLKPYGAQIVVAVIPSLEGRDIESVANETFRAWGIGDAKKDNGLLLLIAFNDKKFRIEVGRGLEGAIPDGRAGDVLRQDLAPSFKEGRYDDGIYKAIRTLAGLTIEEYGGTFEDLDVERPDYLDDGPSIDDIIFFLVFITLLLILRSRTGGTGYRRGGVYYIPRGPGSGGSSFGGGSGFGGGGGGGFSGGGGSSGGGGASGGW